MNTKFNINKSYILLWISQSVSQLGSAMTGFALDIWAFKQTNSAMTVSLLTFFSYLPYILGSIFSGAFVDAHKKKPIMLCTNLIASICSFFVMMLFFTGNLQIWHIYFVNTVIGFMVAFQNPASTVAIGLLVPKEKYTKISGMNSFSNSIITVITPMAAAFISSFWGFGGVLLIDVVTFIFAISVLLLFIHIPEKCFKNQKSKRNNVLRGCKECYAFLLQHKEILSVFYSMALFNFLSRLTYENILPAMILSRSGGNNKVLGIVSAALGIGGIAGGLLVSVIKLPKNSVKMIYLSAGLSFLLGDLFLGMGRNVFVWIFAAIAASVPIPFITAGQNVIMYSNVPKEIQGRVFALRNTVQYFTIPIAILLGGYLADYVFEPFMRSTTKLSCFLQQLVGTGKGSGMAVMFLFTGVLGSVSSLCFYKSAKTQKLGIINHKMRK